MGVYLCFKCIKYWIFIIHICTILDSLNGRGATRMKKYKSIDFTFTLAKFNVNHRSWGKAENKVDHHP